MKASVRLFVVFSVLLCCVFSYGRNVGAAFDTDEDYTITVVGGYAMVNGMKTVSAKCGDYIEVYADVKEGEYVKEWKSNSIDISWSFFDESGNFNTSFTMPAKNVTVYAVTAKQKPLTVDLKNGYQKLPGYQDWYNNSWYNPIDAWICQSAGRKNGYYSYNVDIDGDGTEDLYFSGTNGDHYPADYALIPLPGGSLSGDVVLNKPNAGPYWPITIKMPAEPVRSEYTITVNGGTVRKDYDDTNGSVSLSVKPGETVFLSEDKVAGSYLSSWLTNGDKWDAYFFVMPAKDVTAVPQYEKQKSYTVDMTKGYSADNPDEVFTVLRKHWVEYGSFYDIDGDGKADVTFAVDDDRTVIPLYKENRPKELTLSDDSGKAGKITFLFPEVKPEYEIKVTGGHAEDQDGNVITKAASGTNVVIRRDAEAGKYWKAWKSDFKVNYSKNMCFGFTMPAKDVSFTAETTTTQTTYTLDFSSSFRDLPDKDNTLLFNALCAFNGYKNYWGYMESADADGDGIVDFQLGPRDEMGEIPGYGMDRRFGTYSLGTDYTMTISDGQIGKLRLIVNNKKADVPVVDRAKGPYKVTLSENVVWGDGNNGKKIEDRVYEVYPGERIGLYGAKGANGTFCSKFDVTGIDYTNVASLYRSPLVLMDIYMPYNDVTVTGILDEPEPLELNLSSGSCVVDKVSYFAEYLRQVSGIEGATDGDGGYRFDMDHDGITDLAYQEENDTLIVYETAYTLTRGSETYKKVAPDELYFYWPLTIRFSEETFYPIENIAYFSEEGSVGGANVKAYLKSESEWYETKAAKAGSELKFVFEKVVYGYELIDYYYINEASERSEFSDKDFMETDESITVTGFTMPAEKITIVCRYRKYQAPTPTPKPTNTPTPTVVPTPDEENTSDVTPVPGEKQEPVEKDDEESNLLYILLAAAGALVVTGAIVAFAVLRRRKKTVKAEEQSTEQAAEELAAVPEAEENTQTAEAEPTEDNSAETDQTEASPNPETDGN